MERNSIVTTNTLYPSHLTSCFINYLNVNVTQGQLTKVRLLGTLCELFVKRNYFHLRIFVKSHITIVYA